MPVRELLRRCTAPLLGVFAIVACASFAHAQTTLDTPTLTWKESGFYRIDFQVTAGASGAPNGFVVQWMKRDDFLAFGWPADEYGPYVNSCDFIGVPWLTTGPAASDHLGAGESMNIQM